MGRSESAFCLTPASHRGLLATAWSGWHVGSLPIQSAALARFRSMDERKPYRVRTYRVPE
jgi:hypothetical protein